MPSLFNFSLLFIWKFDSLNSTFALRLALIKFLRTTIVLTSNCVLRLVLAKYSWSSPQTISNSQLHVLPHFHLCPIYLVVFKGVYFLKNGISHLEGGFTLRCLQRLSLPDLATLPWSWHCNRYTSGPSIPVLSY